MPCSVPTGPTFSVTYSNEIEFSIEMQNLYLSNTIDRDDGEGEVGTMRGEGRGGIQSQVDH